MAKKSNANPTRRRGTSSRSPTLFILGGIAIVAAVILVWVAFSLTPASQSGGAPKLQVSTDRLDLGKQLFDHTVHASFTIQNTGTGTLTLQVPRTATLVEGC